MFKKSSIVYQSLVNGQFVVTGVYPGVKGCETQMNRGNARPEENCVCSSVPGKEEFDTGTWNTN